MEPRFLEKIILKGCLLDKGFLATITSTFRAEYFDDPVISEIFSFLKNHLEQYDKIPPRDAIRATLSHHDDEIREIFTEMDTIDFDVAKNFEYLVKESNEYLKDKAVKRAILDSVDIINSGKIEERGKIRELVELALAKDLRIDIGLDYFDMLGERLKRIFTTSSNRIQTYFPQFDEYLNGGFPPFTFSVLVARVHGFKCVGGNTEVLIKDRMNNTFPIRIQDFYKYIETMNKYKNGEIDKMPSINSFIRKYGDEEGKKKYLSWKENVSIASKNRNTLEFFISKYGEKVGNERYNLYIEKQKISHSEQIRGRKKHKEISSRSGNNKNSYIKKYGEEIGIRKWEERQKR
ncbi:MAG TPA: hypothetical protein P5293_07245 [Bacteroidales bacterium]|nr:hypothetical protein [Bacteroidales bacterium]